MGKFSAREDSGLRRLGLPGVEGRSAASRDRTACGWECDRGFSPSSRGNYTIFSRKIKQLYQKFKIVLENYQKLTRGAFS
jgi:hypothetical protein